jgi:hypothetical protein
MNENQRELLEEGCAQLESRGEFRWGLEFVEVFAASLRAALAEVERLRAEVAALKAQSDPLAEMWRELESYQPQADADGHGESWRRMCEERTPETARAAGAAARRGRKRGAWALEAAYAAANQIAEGCAEAEAAIAAIRRAKEEER